jgi:hypothetical protein
MIALLVGGALLAAWVTWLATATIGGYEVSPLKTCSNRWL